ncbi:hypothetical protein QJS10_CPB20g00387 [Acorus calamus]|uniref:Uncharacterized protein n=1 Tax=Acorus calamus TaxID=4465 RepID=A0AAV9CBX3_ACOCL|nr:hypothetical protein QJS10_CPB20g00387 [Acorus calamus]
MGGWNDTYDHESNDKGLFSNLVHGMSGYPPGHHSGYGYPPQGTRRILHKAIPTKLSSTRLSPTTARLSPQSYPQQGYPPQGYPPHGYLPSGHYPSGSHHGHGGMGTMLAGGAAAAAAAYGMHHLSHGHIMDMVIWDMGMGMGTWSYGTRGFLWSWWQTPRMWMLNQIGLLC